MAVTVLAENASFISLVGLAVEQVFHIQTEPAIIPLKMGLNQSVIEQNPIGNQLDYFHETFRSTCARLNIPVSTDAVQQVVNSGEDHRRVGSGDVTYSFQAAMTWMT